MNLSLTYITDLCDAHHRQSILREVMIRPLWDTCRDLKRPADCLREALMDQPIEILVISSDLGNRRALVDILQTERGDPICASTVNESHELFVTRNIILVFCDRQLSDGTYRDVLKTMRTLNTHVPLVVTSRLADWDEYVEALHEGAFDLIVFPCRPSDVTWIMLRAQHESKKRPARIGPAKPHDDMSYREAIRAGAEIQIEGYGVHGELRRKAKSA